MSAYLTRRSLVAGLMTLAPLSVAPVAGQADASAPVTMADLIRAHQDALAAERRAVSDCNRAARIGSAALPDLRAKRDELRKARHSARRNLRRATPQNGEEFALLADYCRGLVPSPDPQDVAATCRRDLEAARTRMGRARA